VMRRVLERQIDIHKLGVLLVVYAYIERRAFSLVLYITRAGTKTTRVTRAWWTCRTATRGSPSR
jgi:hypothetical protein